MELSKEQTEILREIISKTKVKNRDFLVTSFFKDKKAFCNDNYFKIYELYKEKIKSAQCEGYYDMKYEIAEKMGMTFYDIDNAIQYIDFICERVDCEISSRYRKDYFRNRKKILMEEQDAVRRKNESKTEYIKKSEVLRRQVEAIINNYDKATLAGKVSKKKIANNIEGIREKIMATGNQTEHRLILASMYVDIGELEKCNEILSELNYQELSPKEKERYKNAKVKEIMATNTNFITYLFDKGYSYEEIKKQCEKQPTSYRAGIVENNQKYDERVGLTPSFIKKVFDELYQNKENIKQREDEENEI